MYSLREICQTIRYENTCKKQIDGTMHLDNEVNKDYSQDAIMPFKIVQSLWAIWNLKMKNYEEHQQSEIWANLQRI